MTKSKKCIFLLSAILFTCVFALATVSMPKINVNADTALAFSGIKADYNNSLSSESGYRELALTFGETNTKIVPTTDTVNQSVAPFDFANKLTINGLTISRIHEIYDKTTVDCSMGGNVIFIRYPEQCILPVDNESCVYLHIANGTAVSDKLLGEVDLTLVGGGWMTGKFTQAEYTAKYKTLTDSTLTSGTHVFTEGSPLAIAALTDTSGNVTSNSFKAILNMGSNPNASLTLVWFGCNIIVKKNKLEVTDANNVNDIKGTVWDLSIKDNTDFVIQITFASKITIVIDNAVIFDVSATYLQSNGGAIWAVAYGGNDIAISDYTDQKTYASSIIYTGKDSYSFRNGDDVVDFSSYFDAFNLYDNTISKNSLIYKYSDGAVVNNKYSTGTHTLTVYLPRVGILPVVKKVININVLGEGTDKVVTFDGKNPTIVPNGGLVAKPNDPVKNSDVNFDYFFDCWTYNGQAWDFEKDVVTSDVDLKSSFVQMDRHFYLLVSFKGLNKNAKLFSLVKGTKIEVSMFDDGLVKAKMYLNNSEISSFNLTSDTEIEIRYNVTYEHHAQKDSTCKEQGNIEYWSSEFFPNVAFGDSEGKTILSNYLLPLKAHVCGAVDYSWDNSGYGYSCTATSQCSACLETVQVTLSATETVLSKGDCENRARIKYTCNFLAYGLGSATTEDEGDLGDHQYKIVMEKEPTDKEDGCVRHYICRVCEQLFIKEDGEYVETTEEEIAVKKQAGCSSSVEFISSISVILLCAGVTVMLLRKKEGK